VAHKIAAAGEDDYRSPLSGADLELRRLFGFYPQPRHRGLAAYVAHANVRLGHGGRNRGDVDGKSTLVRGCVFLGDWGHVAGRAHAKPAFWVSGLAVHQLFHLAFMRHCRCGVPDVDSPIPAIPHVYRASVAVVGILFCGYSGYRQTDGC
jgi:hypothetical protein